MFLCQCKDALEIIDECGLLGAKPIDFPIAESHKLALACGQPLKDAARYRRLVGCLIYLTITRPDLTYAIHVLLQFMHSPKTDHMDDALRIMHYLKGTAGEGIFLPSDSDLIIRLLWLRLGYLPSFPAIFEFLLYQTWWLTHIMANKETGNGIPIVSRSWIQSHGSSN